jgi:hypothetical protein
MSRRSILATPAVVLVLMTLTTRVVLGIYCWGGPLGSNPGGGRTQTAAQGLWGGVRADVNLEDPGTIPNNQGIYHPMQVLTSGPDWLGWGTMQGEGTHNSTSTENCPDDYSSGWHIYLDGFKDNVYFCRAIFGDVGTSASNQLFTLRYGDCNGVNKWRAYVNGTRKTCVVIDGTAVPEVVAGVEVLQGNTTALHVDTRFHDAERYAVSSGAWQAWTNQDASVCVDTPMYYITVTAPDDFTIAENS